MRFAPVQRAAGEDAGPRRTRGENSWESGESGSVCGTKRDVMSRGTAADMITQTRLWRSPQGQLCEGQSNIKLRIYREIERLFRGFGALKWLGVFLIDSLWSSDFGGINVNFFLCKMPLKWKELK